MTSPIEQVREALEWIGDPDSNVSGDPYFLHKRAREALPLLDQIAADERARESGCAEILAEYAAFINARPELISLLYDIDMLPEQCRTRIGAVHLAGLCEVWKRYEAAKADERAKVVASPDEIRRLLSLLKHMGHYADGHSLSEQWAKELGDLKKEAFDFSKEIAARLTHHKDKNDEKK